LLAPRPTPTSGGRLLNEQMKHRTGKYGKEPRKKQPRRGRNKERERCCRDVALCPQRLVRRAASRVRGDSRGPPPQPVANIYPACSLPTDQVDVRGTHSGGVGTREVFPQHKYTDTALISHDRFLLNPFQFIYQAPESVVK
jgi:hypothetical protein